MLRIKSEFENKQLFINENGTIKEVTFVSMQILKKMIHTLLFGNTNTMVLREKSLLNMANVLSAQMQKWRYKITQCLARIRICKRNNVWFYTITM